MTVDLTVIPGLLLLAAELAALAAVGYVVVRVALQQADARLALAQGLVVGPALWGIVVSFALYVLPGLAGAAVGWGIVVTLGGVLAWRAPRPICPQPRVAAGFVVAALAVFWVALASRQTMSVVDPYTSPRRRRLDPGRRVSTRAFVESRDSPSDTTMASTC